MRDEALKVMDGFLRAEYGCDALAGPPLHIGEGAATGVARHWITAWNPLGLPRDEEANHADQHALAKDLGAAGLVAASGFARSPANAPPPRWCEPCAVIQDAPDAAVDALAQRYRQLAIVVWRPGETARLRCYRRVWRERFGITDMDARNVEWVA